MNTKRLKTLSAVALKFALTIATAGGAIYMLYAFGYITQAKYIDNIVAVIPIALSVLLVAAVSLLLWLDFAKKIPVLMLCLAVTAAVSVALFPNAVIGNWWIGKTPEAFGDSADISVYEPFKEKTLAVTLDEPSSLVLDSELPVMDGALALYPLYASFAQNFFDKTAYDGNKDSVMFTNTLKAYDGIIAGERDVIFVAGASKKQAEKAAAVGAELVFTPIGKEAFVFLVGKTNPIDNITTAQIKNIYSGKTTLWSTLGWKDGGRIVAFQRPEGSGSQTGLQQIMGNLPIASPRPLPDESLIGTNSLMKQISVEYNGVQPALGYSYRFFAISMLPNADSKMLAVDGVYPDTANIKSGAYPFTVEYYAVTNGAPKGNTKKLIDFILSEKGREITEKVGYSAL